MTTMTEQRRASSHNDEREMPYADDSAATAPEHEGRTVRGPVVGAAAAATAIGCCAASPALAGAASGLGIAAVTGAAAGVLLALAAIAGVTLTCRRALRREKRGQ